MQAVLVRLRPPEPLQHAGRGSDTAATEDTRMRIYASRTGSMHSSDLPKRI